MADDFLAYDKERTKEAKWNMFKFQDHLLSWISLSAQYWQIRDYPNTFESLTNVYSDTYGFFTTKEKIEIDEVFKRARISTDDYSNYNTTHTKIQAHIKGKKYVPPSNVHFDLLDFRKKLMELMTKY